MAGEGRSKPIPRSKGKAMKKLSEFSKPLAWLIALAMMAVALLGIGGLKLNAKYNNALKSFRSAVNSPDSSGNTFESDYAKALGFALPVQAGAEKTLAGSETARQLTACLEKASALKKDPANGYPALAELNTAVVNAYDAVRRADTYAADDISGAYANFLSSYKVISNTYSSAYNNYKEAVDTIGGGFPASFLKNLWGIGNETD